MNYCRYFGQYLEEWMEIQMCFPCLAKQNKAQCLYKKINDNNNKN